MTLWFCSITAVHVGTCSCVTIAKKHIACPPLPNTTIENTMTKLQINNNLSFLSALRTVINLLNHVEYSPAKIKAELKKKNPWSRGFSLCSVMATNWSIVFMFIIKLVRALEPLVSPWQYLAFNTSSRHGKSYYRTRADPHPQETFSCVCWDAELVHVVPLFVCWSQLQLLQSMKCTFEISATQSSAVSLTS